MNDRHFKIFITLTLLFIILSGCANSPVEPEEIPERERGYLFSAQEISVYTPAQIEQILAVLDIDHSLSLNYDVQVIRIEYQTIGSSGQGLHASGAIMVPVTTESVPLLAINHGTVTKRSDVASQGPLNAVEGVGGLITASLGYLTCVPDYIGFGVSQEIHPYVHAKSLAVSIIDMIRATINYGQSAGINSAADLFLTGYSEGGYATLATQKEIETNYASEFNLTAVAPMAGPYDLAGVVDSILSQDSYPSPVYIAFLLTAYNAIYKWDRLDEIFNAPYASQLPDFFDGTRSYSEINNALPEKINSLVKPAFVSAYLNGDEKEVHEAIEENTLLNWSPATQIRFFHGNADQDVPYDNVLRTVTNLRSRTSVAVELVTIEGGTHETAGIPCIFGMIDWFEQIKAGLPVNTSLAWRQARVQVAEK
jgi:hypothetical protein